MTAVGTGLVVGVVALAATLSQSPVTVARGSIARGLLGRTDHALSACQLDEVLPRGTTAVRLGLHSFLGPRVMVGLFEHEALITTGEHGSGWAGIVTVPVKPLPETRSSVELCFKFYTGGDEAVELVGELTPPARAAHTSSSVLPGRLGVEYMHPASSSWWSLALPVARRMGLGRGWAGTWSALLVVVFMGGLVVLCLRIVVKELA